MGEKNNKQMPEHKVTVSNFWICKYEITLSEFKEFISDTDYITTAKSDGWFCIYLKDDVIQKHETKEQFYWRKVGFEQDEHEPVVCVGWYDTIEYCNWKSKKEGLEECYLINKSKRDRSNLNPNDKFLWTIECNFDANGYRLPTEAEWEFAYKGGVQSKGFLYSGDNLPDKIGWFINNSDYKTHPVGQKNPNELGLYDMTGNVMEWVWDWVGKYSVQHLADPTGPKKGRYKIVKGSSWHDEVKDGKDMPNHILINNGQGPYKSSNVRGFRVVRSGKK